MFGEDVEELFTLRGECVCRGLAWVFLCGDEALVFEVGKDV